MTFTVYSSFKNIPDFNEGIAIQCFPERHSAHDVALTINTNDVVILSNQSGLYIQKKVKKSIKNIFKKKNK
jgi:hypothetical protein